MAEKKDWRNHSAYFSRGPYVSESSGGQKEDTGDNWRYYSSNFKDYDLGELVGKNATKRINSWLSRNNSYLSDYNKRYESRKFNYEDAYVTDSASWLETATKRADELEAERQEILTYISQNKKYLDPEWVKSVEDALSGESKKHKGIIESATMDNDYWLKFTPNKEQTAAGYTAEKLYSEWQKSEQQRADDLAYDVNAGEKELALLRKKQSEFEKNYSDPVDEFAKGNANRANGNDTTARWMGWLGVGNSNGTPMPRPHASDADPNYGSVFNSKMVGNDAYSNLEALRQEYSENGYVKSPKRPAGLDTLVRFQGETQQDETSPYAREEEPYRGSKSLRLRQYDQQIAELEARVNRARYVQTIEGWKKKYDGMSLDDINIALNNLEDGEEKDWLEDNKWSRAFAESDFEQYAANGAAIKNPTYEEAEGSKVLWWGEDPGPVGNVVTYSRDNASMLALAEGNNGETKSGNYRYRSLYEDEVKLYNYLLAKYGADEAQKFLDYMMDELNKREGGALAKRLRDIDIPVIEQLAIGGFGLASGMEQWSSGTRQFFTNDVLPTTVTQYANDALAQSATGIGKYAYQATNVIGNMLPSIMLTKGLGALGAGVKAAKLAGVTAMSLGAAGNAYADGIERYGMEPWEARAYGTLVGASEGALEYVMGGIPALRGADDIVSAKIKTIDQSLLRVGAKLGWNTLGEIGEEELQNYLEPLFRSFFTGEYDAPTFDELLETAIVTLISTPAMSGGEVINDVHSARKAYKQYGDKTDALIQEGLESDVNSESYKLTQQFQQQVQGQDGQEGKPLSGNQIRNLLEANQEQITPKDLKKIQQAAEKRLTALGQTENVARVAELATKRATGKKLTRSERSELANSQYGARVANELLPKNILSGGYSSEWAEDIGTKKVNSLAYNNKALVRELVEAMSEDPTNYKSLESRMDEDKTAKVSSTGKAVIRATNEEIDLSNPKIKTITKDSVVLDVDGKDVDVSEIDFPNEDQWNMFNALKKIEHITPAAASAMIAKLDMSKPIWGQLNGMDEAFTYGYYNYSEADLKAGLFTGNLTKDQLNDAFKLGRYVAEKSQTDKAERFKAMRTAAQAEAEKAEAEGKGKPQPKNLTITYNKGNGEVVSMDEAFKDGELDKKRSGAVGVAKILHEMGLGTKIEFFSSYISKTLKVKNKKGEMVAARVFLDANGNEKIAYSGVYRKSDGTIRVDLNAYNGRGLTLNALAHELTHFIQQWSAKKYKVLVDFLMKEYENTDLTMHERVLREQKRLEEIRGEEVSYDEAYDEVVANAMSKMFDDGNMVEKLAKLKEQDMTLAQKLWEGFKEILSKFLGIYQKEGALFQDADDLMQMKKTFDQLQNMFAEALVEASENYQASLTPGVEGTVVSKTGEAVAHATEEGTVQLSMHTYDTEGRDVFRNYLEKCVSSKKLTKAEMTEMLDGIDEIYQVCKEFKDKYAPFGTWSDAAVVRDTHGRPVFSVVTPNGDYKMNLDFSLVCKKRRTLDAVFNEMSKRGIIDDFELGQKSVVKINEIIRKYGLETACALCFVDAKRFRQASMADSFTRLYNELVESLVPEDQKSSISHFNFSGYDTIKNVENGIDTWDNSKLDFSHINHVLKTYGSKSVEYKTAKYIKTHAEGRKLLLRGDFMSSNGFDAVKSQNPDVLKLYNSKKGTGGPKAAFGDVQYMNEIIQKARWWTPEKAYAVGGVRIQSFSDYVPRMVFDYVQMIYDLAATDLPAHAYTKESLFVKQFGLTGIKINMSLIPAIAEGGIAPGLDANGNYVWAGESFDYETAKDIQNAEGYTENCGTICVGVSKEHILKLLRDPNIRMVIPYHKSGLNPIVAHMNKIAEFHDYTNDQRTKGKDGKALDKDFDFNKALHDMGENANPKSVADQYLKWCAAHGYTPRFAEFAMEENYYKLLEDFTLYDKDGKYVPQRAVKAVFPTNDSAFGSMKSLIEAGLHEDAVIEGKRDKNLSAIVDEIQKTIPKTEAEIEETQVEQADHDLEQYSSQETDANADEKKVYSYEGLPADAFYNEDYSYIYSYDFLTAQKDMTIVDSLPPLQELQTDRKIDPAKVLAAGYKNIIEMGGTKVGDTYRIINTYTNRPLQIGKSSITHGLGAEDLNAKRTNARLAAVIGELCKNAIPICALPNTHNVRGTYGMAVLVNSHVNGKDMNMIALITVEQQNGNVQSVDFVDVAHAVSGRLVRDIEKENRSAQGTPPGTKSEWATRFSSPINITQFLNIVNRTHQGYLSDDVISKLGEDRRGAKKALYSEHDTDYSNRSLLANAFEGITKSSAEYKLVQEYKGRIRILNEQEEKLSKLNAEIHKVRFTKGEYDAKKLKELEAEAKNVSESINRQDRKLISLEASEPLRKFIEQERKKEALKTIDHVKEIVQNKKQRAEQTELRHKIRKAVRDLDKILNRGNKKRNVKQDMKGFVSKALELADYLFTDHISNDELIRNGITVRMTPQEAALVKETEDILSQIYDNADNLTDEEFTRLDEKRKANEDKLRDLLTAQRNERLSTPVYNLFNDLVTEYANLKNSKQEAVKAAYDPNVERFLRSYIGESDGETDSDRKTLLQNMRVADMTTDELWKLHNAYKMVLHSVRSANTLWVKGKTETIEQMAGRIMGDFSKRKIPDKKVATVIRNLSNKIGWDYEKLYYALDRIGSEAFTELVMNIANSENIVMQDVIEAAAFRDEMVKEYGFNNWDVNKKIDREFLDNTGKKFKLTLGELMSLYAYSRRKGAWDHIEYGGFVFGEKALTNPRPADSYKLSKEQVEAITSLLTDKQKAYVEAMQKFLSETMGAKGNEVSMQLYGIEMFTEKNYFPIHIAGQFKAQANESQAKAAAGFGTMSNAGFTHAQNPNAKAPFVMEGFNEIWADHVNEMSRYHGTVPALEDMRRVMNRSSYFESGMESMAIKQLMENSFGKEAVDYFDNLYREANSGAITDKLQKPLQKLLNNFRKNSVAYSLSVLIQQPASVVRAYAMIDRKYFGVKGVGTITSGVVKALSDKWTKAHTNAYNEMLKYAPGVTMAKEIGGFDTHTGGSIRRYLLDTSKSLKQKWKTGTVAEKGKAVLDLVDDNAIANLPNLADKIAWIEIWNACKRETVAKHKDLATNSDEFLQIVGDRFTEVIRATQVYDSIFAKSPMLKSKNLAVQSLVSFMNEPNTVANMVEKAVRDISKGNWKSGATTAVVVIHSIIFTSLLKSIIYAMRDDDEDETYTEKYIEALTGSLMDDFWALNYIPLARDVWSLAQGYDVERADMAIVADALDALNRVIQNATINTDDMTEEQLAEFEKKVTEANWKLVESMASFFGIPVKNVRREVEGVLDHARIAHANAGKTTPLSAWNKIRDAVIDSIPFMSAKESKQDKLYEAIVAGDTVYVGRLKAGYKDEDAYNAAVRKAMRENDPRIRAAAQAYYDGNLEEYKRIFKEIRNEDKHNLIGFDNIMEAVMSEVSSIKVETEPKTESSDYSATDFVNSVMVGNTDLADTMKEDIISYKIANGATREEAEEAFASSVSTSTRNAFDSGLLGEAEAEKMLMEYTGVYKEEAASKVDYWSFIKEHPQYRGVLTQSNVEKYHEFAEPAEIPLDVFVQYINSTKGIETKYDKWGDVELSVREQVLDAIDSLPISWQQKDALYLAHGYAESKIWDVPW